MNLKELRAKGAFVSPVPEQRTVTWKSPDGEVTFDVHIKRMAFGDWERLFVDKDDERSRSAAILSQTVMLGEKGKESLPYVDAYQLDPTLAAVLMEAVTEVNGPKR